MTSLPKPRSSFKTKLANSDDRNKDLQGDQELSPDDSVESPLLVSGTKALILEHTVGQQHRVENTGIRAMILYLDLFKVATWKEEPGKDSKQSPVGEQQVTLCPLSSPANQACDTSGDDYLKSQEPHKQTGPIKD